MLTVTTSTCRTGARPRHTAEAHWLERGLLAWDLPAEASGWSFRLHAAPDGGLVVDEEAILGGESFPLTLDPDGLPADVREQWPHLAAYDALRLSRHDARDVEELLTGQLAVAAYDDLGRLVDATGVQIPGVLDDVYDDAVRPRPRGHVARPHAQAGGVGADGQGRRPARARPGAADGHAGRDASRRRRCLVGAPATRDWNGASYLFEVDVYVPPRARS